MRSKSFIVRLLLAFFCLTFITEGRLFDPGARPDDRSSSSELGRFSNVIVTPKCTIPPFIPPFELSDPVAFEVSSSCPFDIHSQITGENPDACFPIYNILQWDSSQSSTYQLKELNRNGDSLVLEKQSTFATGEEFDLVLTASSSNLGACISDMEMKVEGINGVISGETGTASIKGIAVSFQEEDKENTILLPVGGCDMNSHQSVRHQKLEDDCSILPNIVDESDCLTKCFRSVETNHYDQMNKLDDSRDQRVSKNLENKDIVLEKMLISRATQMSIAFARCRCKHNEQDLAQCVLRIFLDTLVSENELQFEVEENFNKHIDEVETWYENGRKLVCDASTGSALKCSEEC